MVRILEDGNSNIGIVGDGIEEYYLNTQTRASELPKHIFQSESYDRIVRDENELNDKLNYILNNPIKWGLTNDGYKYQWYYLDIS